MTALTTQVPATELTDDQLETAQGGLTPGNATDLAVGVIPVVGKINAALGFFGFSLGSFIDK